MRLAQTRARTMISSFDPNKNGVIDLDNSSGIPSMDERVKTESRTQSENQPSYDFTKNEWTVKTNTFDETRSSSAATVWDTANVSPKDRQVTDVELARLMSRYDSDHDGVLKTPEQQTFAAAHPLFAEAWGR